MKTWVVKLEADGLIPLPEELLDEMHIQDGDELLYEVRGSEIVLVQAQDDNARDDEIQAT
jgi:bifunctional DNA-binding transcriptional regulator/antitoxin component of YhaV-PrlF toxin-antitoxin module